MADRKLHEKFETWVIVTVITALVWLYAEATVLQQVASQPIQIKFAVPPGQEFAVLPVVPTTVRVSFEASSGQVQQFRSLTAEPLIIELEPLARDAVSQQVVILSEALLKAGLAELGIIDLNADPPTQAVTLKPLREVSLRVEVQAGSIPLDPETRPTTTPDRVNVTVPVDVARDLRDSFVLAKLPEVVTSPAPGGNREQVAREVPLEFPAGVDFDAPWTEVSQTAVQVNYTLERPDDTIKLARVPLYVNLPVSLQQEYVVRPADEAKFLLDVELQGPSETIERIRANDPQFQVRAELRITDPSRIEQITAVQPVVVAPVGVTPTKTPDLMTVNVRRRSATGAAPVP